LTPVVPLAELGPLPRPLSPEGSMGRLWSGDMVELRVAPDVVLVVPSSAPDAANAASGDADNNPARNSEVMLMFIMVVSREESYLMLG
jgi:hypothetical protein